MPMVTFCFIVAAVGLVIQPEPMHQQPTRSRRDVVSLALSATALLPAVPALASGGATSGKTTSIPRAKLRYYGRITTVVAAFQNMKKSITAGDIKMAKSSFYSTEYETQDKSMSTAYDELKSAGYLLAVAFKIDSKIPPDRIQQVKDWRKLMVEMDKLKESLSGKADKAAVAYDAASAAINVWLDGVELPLMGDERYAAA